MPQATVAAIITNHTGEVLLTRRTIEPFKGKWCLPGGHIDRNEPARNAIIREVKEETGLDFNPTFFNYFDEIIPVYNVHNVVMVFYGSAAGTLMYDCDEVSEIGWVPFNEALKLDLAFTHKTVLETYMGKGVRNDLS